MRADLVYAFASLFLITNLLRPKWFISSPWFAVASVLSAILLRFISYSFRSLPVGIALEFLKGSFRDAGLDAPTHEHQELS